MSEVEQAFLNEWPAERWSDVRVVVAVSGGSDSMALLRLLHGTRPVAATGKLVVAHFNHRWRGEHSNADADFVAACCNALEIELVSGKADVVADSEDEARQQRRSFFDSVLSETGARYLATGHTADDQVETVLHRVLRGTGVAGLTGIPRIRAWNELVTLRRPLLGFTRRQLQDHLTALGETWRMDATNEDEQYTRNRIRQRLLPLLREAFNPDVDQAVLRLSNLAGQCQAVIDDGVDQVWSAVKLGERVTIQRQPLQVVRPFIVSELFKRIWSQRGWPQQGMTQEHWEGLAQMVADPPTSSRHFPGGLLVSVSDKELRIERA